VFSPGCSLKLAAFVRDCLWPVAAASSGRSLKLAAFVAQNDPLDRFVRRR
jgi:hypothetical protein